MQPKDMPPLNLVRSIISYDGETGEFIWAQDRIGGNGTVVAAAGERAGYLASNGYWVVSINGAKYTGHRLAWWMTYGMEPPPCLDHISMDKADNRICNLRAADKSINGINRKPQSNNKSGLSGLLWDKDRGKWQVRLGAKHLGRFDCLGVAATVRQSAVANFYQERA